MAPWVLQIFIFFLASSFFGVPHPPSRSDDGRTSLHTFAWEYFDSYLRVFECFRTSSFRPGPIKLLQNANNATQHGVSETKNKAYSNSLACWASSRKLIKLQHLLAITQINQIALWGITEQLPTILIRLSSPRTKPQTKTPPSYTARMAQLSQLRFWCYACSQPLL